jgi:deazaflavin-dependent oxidoreductase (nitroreductase family)
MTEDMEPTRQQRLDRLSLVADQEFGYLTTFGRKTGRPHEIEIWFAAAGGKIYMLSGGRDASDWVKNVLANPEVSIRIGDQTFVGMARIITSATEEEDQARRLLAGKYEEWEADKPLSDWAATSLPVAIDINP